MSEFTFKVNLVAVVRVRAADESVARQVVSTILGAPGTVEIGLANENNAAVGNHATITDVDFSFLSWVDQVLWGQGSKFDSTTPARSLSAEIIHHLWGRGFSASPRWATPSRHQGLESAVDRPTTHGSIRPEIVSVTSWCCLMERAELVAQALVFLVRLTGEDVPLDEAMNALSALAEQFQSGAIVGGTLIDSSSATFDRVVYPSLLASPFSTLRHVPISSPIFGTCAKAVRERKIISCSDTATEVDFDVSWRSLYLGLGIHSVQSAPVFSFNGRPLGTFVVAIRQPHASFDREMTGFGVYAMRTILQK